MAAALSGKHAVPAVNPPSSVSGPGTEVDPTHARWFNEEVYAHDASLKNYLRRSFPAVRDPDDVVQESYVRVWRRQMAQPIAQVTGAVRVSVKSFLFQVARRLAIDTLRRNRASPLVEAADLAALPALERGITIPDAVCTQQEFELVLEAIAALPARCREVVVLRKLHGLSAADTAGRLAISEETVHVLTRRGLKRVQRFLGSRGICGTSP